ncbi:Hsp20/alpha crystallin family protein [Natrinema gelatinilyticum]|uniref:Hsp20/alpha crystallin family protein n=1 Tax=Natrinema gelatinilyticum TaxID=2961571 RepID=UPI0020C34DC0|nr:Hsp20/alpha crystallin family protein [Natrinema gelatinilyticum]
MEDEPNADEFGDSTRDREEVPVDITEQRDEILVGAELPGLRKQDIDVSVSGNTLTIEAEREGDPITRTVDLPEPIVPNRVDASYEDGVLWLTLRKQH